MRSTADGLDVLLIDGDVVTMVRPGERAQAVGVKDGGIVAVGDQSALREMTTPDTHVISLDGRTLLPGFIDSHVHAFATGLQFISGDGSSSSSIADLCSVVAERAARSATGEWVFVLNCSPWKLKERRFPHRQELDRAAPHNPAFLCSTTFHSSAANSPAIKAIRDSLVSGGIHPDVDGFNDGWFLTDETHIRAARLAFGSLSDATIGELYRAVGVKAASKGVTTLHCLDGQFIEADRDVSVLHRIRNDLSVDVVLYYQTMDVERVVALGLPRIGGCLMVDGACYEHTARFYEPYLDAPGVHGRLNYTETELERFVTQAHANHLQIAMHAIGDQAIDYLAGVYERVLAKSPCWDHRHRIEHFMAPTGYAIEQAQHLELSVGAQPIFSYLWDQPDVSDYERQFGATRSQAMEPFKALVDAGVLVAGGSDSPVTAICPLLGVHSAVNNPRPVRRLGVYDALCLFTVNGARIAHEEDSKGTIEVGKRADFVALSGDPFAQTGHIDELGVDLTMCGGQVSFDGAGLS